VGVGKLQLSLNLLAFNVPVEGPMYITQGAGVGLKNTPVLGIPLGVGVDRESFNGGLSFENYSWSGTNESRSASREGGLGFEVGLGVGISLSHLENLLNLVLSCAE
jgi:hypothetical protein